MQQRTLKIISLNIEMDNHFERILPFINEVQPDVILLQEVLGKDKAYLEEMTGMTGHLYHSKYYRHRKGRIFYRVINTHQPTHLKSTSCFLSRE